jgi:hypothetical protein
MLPLYLARIEDLGRGDFVKVDCAACYHVALLTPEFPTTARAQPSGQGATSQITRQVPRLRSRGTRSRFGHVGRQSG